MARELSSSDYLAFKAEVVSDLSADDYGVYEVFWLANGRYPDWPVSRRLAVAEQVVADLLAEGSAVLVQAPWIGAEDRQAVQDVEATLRAWATWVPDDPVVWLTIRNDRRRAHWPGAAGCPSAQGRVAREHS